MTATLIEMSALSKTFRRDSVDIPVLRDINLKVCEGDFISLMGPSGSGKTTLLNIVAGIDFPSGGELRVLDADLLTMSRFTCPWWRPPAA